MRSGLLSRAGEFMSVFLRRSIEIIRNADRGMRCRTLGTYLRFKLKSGWFALTPGRQPDQEKLFDWNISIGNYSDFVFLFEEIFVAQSYKFALTSSAPVIVDGGANIGLATLYFKLYYPGADIRSVEPEPNAYSRLESNILSNGLTNVTLYNKALGRGAGEMEFHYSSSRPASPLAGPNRGLGESKVIDVVPLSSLVDCPVDLIKLDVEGAETEVMKELVESGAISKVGVILLEYHHHLRRGDDHLSEILSLLENAGFGYQITQARISQPGDYQDFVLCAYRKEQLASTIQSNANSCISGTSRQSLGHN